MIVFVTSREKTLQIERILTASLKDHMLDTMEPVGCPRLSRIGVFLNLMSFLFHLCTHPICQKLLHMHLCSPELDLIPQ